MCLGLEINYLNRVEHVLKLIEMKNLFLLLIIYSFAISCLLAQEKTASSIYGFVVDEEGYPVIGANIRYGLKKNSYKGTSTDELGAFEIAENGFEEIAVSYLGYETRRLKLTELQNEAFIELKPTAHELEIVYVVRRNARLTHLDFFPESVFFEDLVRFRKGRLKTSVSPTAFFSKTR